MKICRLPCLLALGLTLTAGIGFIPLCAHAAANEALGPKINLKANQTFMGHFVHEHPVQGFEGPMRSEGHFTVDGNDKIVWAIEKPMMTTTTITNEGLTQSVGNFTLLRVSADKMPFLAEMQKNLLWALSGKWDKLRKDFTITQSGTNDAWEVTITPKEQEGVRKPFQKLIAKGKTYVEKAEIVLPSGTVDHLTFSNSVIAP